MQFYRECQFWEAFHRSAMAVCLLPEARWECVGDVYTLPTVPSKFLQLSGVWPYLVQKTVPSTSVQSGPGCFCGVVAATGE